MPNSLCLRELSIQIVPEDAWHAEGDDGLGKVVDLNQDNESYRYNFQSKLQFSI